MDSTQAEKLNRPPFDILNAGAVLAHSAPIESAALVDNRNVDVIIILGPDKTWLKGIAFDLGGLSALVAASQRPAALSDASPLIKASRETWATVGSTGIVDGLRQRHCRPSVRPR